MSSFDTFVSAVEAAVADLAGPALAAYLRTAQSAVGQYLADSAADLETWTGQLASGDLSQEEFQGLVQGDLDLGKLAALTQAGVALAQLQAFRDALIGKIVDIAIHTFIP